MEGEREELPLCGTLEENSSESQEEDEDGEVRRRRNRPRPRGVTMATGLSRGVVEEEEEAEDDEEYDDEELDDDLDLAQHMVSNSLN